MVEKFILGRRIDQICSSWGRVFSNNTEGHRERWRSGERRRGYSQTKWQRTITGTTNVTDIAEGGAGEGLQTRLPNTPELGWGYRNKEGGKGRRRGVGRLSLDLLLCPLMN